MKTVNSIRNSHTEAHSMRRPKIMFSVSMAIFGTLGLFTRNISLSSGELALYRAILAAALILVYLALTKQKIDLKSLRRDIPLLLASGAAMGINWILLFQAYRYTTISAATLSYYFAPVIVTAACPLLFREMLTGRQILCFAMSTLGLALITLSGGLSGGRDLIGILLGLGAASFYAAVILLNKFIRQIEGIHRTLLQFLAAILVLTPYVALTKGFCWPVMNLGGWASLLTVGLIHTGMTYCLYFSALKELPGQTAAILSYIDPLVAVVISVCLLGEPITFRQLLGGCMILGFTLLNELAPRPQAQGA